MSVLLRKFSEMPSNRNNAKKRKTPLDLPVIHDLEEFEYNFCQYVDKAMPAKFRNSYVKQIMRSLDGAMEEGLMAMTTDQRLFLNKKIMHIDNSLAKLYHVSTRLNRLNDMQQISDKTKAVLDMKLYDIIDGFTRFSSSLRNISIAGQVPPGTPYGETGELEGCLTDCDL